MFEEHGTCLKAIFLRTLNGGCIKCFDLLIIVDELL
jgi:hypothetical protein